MLNFRSSTVALLVCLHLLSFLGAQAVDVVMYIPYSEDTRFRLLYEPGFREKMGVLTPAEEAIRKQFGTWQPPEIWCRNLPPGRCCNNIFAYGGVNVTGLSAGFVVTAWKRFRSVDRWLGMQQWEPPTPEGLLTQHVPNPPQTGCDGIAIDVGAGDGGGFWTRPNPFQNQKPTGVMWWNCAEDPKSALRALFGSRLVGTQSTLRALVSVALHTCANVASAVLPRATYALKPHVDATSLASNQAPDPSSGQTQPASSNETTPSSPCLNPDLILFNHTSFTAANPGELRFVDSNGSVLDLALLAALANETIHYQNVTTANAAMAVP